MTPAQLEAALSNLDPDELDQVGWLLRERAARLRRRLSVAAAIAAVRDARISDAWQESGLVELGRLRRAAMELILDGWRPEQIVDSLAEVGLAHAFPDGQTVALAISRGVRDARLLQR